MAGAFATALVIVPFVLAVAQGPDEPSRLMERVAEDFIGEASKPWSDFRVCEHRSRVDDKRSFLRKSLGEELFPSTARIAWKELRVSEEDASSSLHLGLAAVTYQSEKEANKVHTLLKAAEQPYLRNTKILTQYKALLRGSTVLIVYSETFRHEALQRFLTALALPQPIE